MGISLPPGPKGVFAPGYNCVLEDGRIRRCFHASHLDEIAVPIPPGWFTHAHPGIPGSIQYYNANTGLSSWKKPDWQAAKRKRFLEAGTRSHNRMKRWKAREALKDGARVPCGWKSFHRTEITPDGKKRWVEWIDKSGEKHFKLPGSRHWKF